RSLRDPVPPRPMPPPLDGFSAPPKRPSRNPPDHDHVATSKRDLGVADIRDEGPPKPAPIDWSTIISSIRPCLEWLRAGMAFLIDRSRGTAVESCPGADFTERVGRAYEGELRTALRVLIISAGVT